MRTTLLVLAACALAIFALPEPAQAANEYTICHIPSANLDDARNITVSLFEKKKHLKHEDFDGKCEDRPDKPQICPAGDCNGPIPPLPAQCSDVVLAGGGGCVDPEPEPPAPVACPCADDYNAAIELYTTTNGLDDGWQGCVESGPFREPIPFDILTFDATEGSPNDPVPTPGIQLTAALYDEIDPNAWGCTALGQSATERYFDLANYEPTNVSLTLALRQHAACVELQESICTPPP
jgi:hypothetical protein